MPSIAPAKPKTTPERIASTVLLPITARGGPRSIFGSFAPRSVSASSEISTPGSRTPPRKSPSGPTMSKFTEVPKSTHTAGPPKRSRMATAFTSRSAPISCGLS